jgi:hypothetical protein
MGTRLLYWISTGPSFAVWLLPATNYHRCCCYRRCGSPGVAVTRGASLGHASPVGGRGGSPLGARGGSGGGVRSSPKPPPPPPTAASLRGGKPGLSIAVLIGTGDKLSLVSRNRQKSGTR